MVIASSYAGFAYAAMLAPCWLEEHARGTVVARIEQDTIVWVVPHVRSVVELGDVCLTVPLRTQICEQVRHGKNERDEELMVS